MASATWESNPYVWIIAFKRVEGPLPAGAKERGILFSAPMVRALLERRKSQTRRVMKSNRAKCPVAHVDLAAGAWDRGPAWWTEPGGWVKCPLGKPGDRLAVKEAAWMWCERRPNGVTKTGRPKWHYVPMREAPVLYCADRPDRPVTSVVSPETGNAWGWRKKLGRFLPRWACRLVLEVTDVRVERLQDISEEDAKAEGVEREVGRDVPAAMGGGVETWRDYGRPEQWVTSARSSFRALWRQIHG